MQKNKSVPLIRGRFRKCRGSGRSHHKSRVRRSVGQSEWTAPIKFPKDIGTEMNDFYNRQHFF